MKFINNTKWNTADLKRLVKVICDHEGFKEINKLEIVSSRSKGTGSNGHYSGYAIPTWKIIRIRVPTPEFTDFKAGSDGRAIRFQNFRVFNVQLFAKVFMHEIGHLRGIMNHREMPKYWNLDADYVGDFKVGSLGTPIVVEDKISDILGESVSIG